VIKPKKADPFKRLVLYIVIGGTILLAIILGVVLGVSLSQKSLFMLDFLNKKLDSWCFFLVEQTVADNSAGYGQSCTIGSNQCISSVGLVCSGGLCGCSSPYSWNTATSTCKRKFSKNFSNEKLFILGTLLTYNQACSTNSQCNSSLGLNCTNSVCQCDGFHAWNSANNSCE